MKKTVRYTIVLFISIEILALLAPSLTAKALEIGVFPGKSFTYGTSAGSPWVTMNPSNAPLLSQWQKFMNLSTWTFNIVSNLDAVDFPNQVRFDQTVTFRNGSKPVQVQGGGLDIGTGEGQGATFFIPAGLGWGDRIYPGSANFTWAINETRVDHTHWNGRRIDVLNITAASNPANGTLFAQRTVIFWDSFTGVLLQVYEGAASGIIDSTGHITGIEGILLYQLIANNAGIPMEYSGPIDMTPIYIVIAISATVAVGAVIVRVATGAPKKKHKRLRE